MGPADELNRGTPRGSMYGFIVACRKGDYERAASFLDLRRLSPEQAERGPELARRFKAVLDQTLWIDFTTLSDANDGASGDGLPAWQDKLGQIQTEDGPVDLLLQRVPRKGDGVRIWKVSAATVAHDRGPPRRVRPRECSKRWLPPVFFDFAFFEIQLWQWLGLALLALVAWAASPLVLATGPDPGAPPCLRARGGRASTTGSCAWCEGPSGSPSPVLLFVFGALMPWVFRSWPGSGLRLPVRMPYWRWRSPGS